tara:strand:- start:57 stop:308 length:252 start_codon:yes stop_codon:yes gene_type:complete
MDQNNTKYLQAIEFALDNKWDKAHHIVQDINTNIAQLIHAVLHKIEGDEVNSRYWYSRSGLGGFDATTDPMIELMEIKKKILF